MLEERGGTAMPLTQDELDALVEEHRFEARDGSCVRHAALDDGTLIIWIGGRTMGGSAIALVEEVEALVGTAESDIVIELSRCEYLSSLVIGMLVGISEREHRGLGRFFVAAANKQNTNLFTMLGCTELFHLHTDLESALRDLGSLAE